MSTRTVKVSNVSLGASEQDVRDFFSFSGVIEYVEMKRLENENERSQTGFVTFKDSQGAETAVLLSGATIVDQSVTIALEPGYTPPPPAPESFSGSENINSEDVGGAASAAHVVSNMLAKGFDLGKDAVSRAKAFDEEHQLTSTATAKIASLDQKIGLSDKISIGASIVSDKAKEMDQQFQVSEKTKSAYAAAGETVSTAGTAVMKNRYILTGTSWVTGAFSRARKAAEEVGQKTMGTVAEDQEHGNK